MVVGQLKIDACQRIWCRGSILLSATLLRRLLRLLDQSSKIVVEVHWNPRKIGDSRRVRIILSVPLFPAKHLPTS